MVAFHHVNLGVPVDGLEGEIEFLTEILGYHRIEANEEIRKMFSPNWYEADDGSQVHLSMDPDHRPAARAHVAIAFGAALADVEVRLKERGIDYESSQTAGFPSTIICQDPAGNRWELRSDQGSTELHASAN
jgi:catechol 2,3-dioxygenase-like lactoylglutathione lyase family enzyme